jgi:hypothetical protein
MHTLGMLVAGVAYMLPTETAMPVASILKASRLSSVSLVVSSCAGLPKTLYVLWSYLKGAESMYCKETCYGLLFI